jgi:hypothetical protein
MHQMQDVHINFNIPAASLLDWRLWFLFAAHDNSKDLKQLLSSNNYTVTRHRLQSLDPPPTISDIFYFLQRESQQCLEGSR